MHKEKNKDLVDGTKGKKGVFALALINLPKSLKILLLFSMLIVAFYHIQGFCKEVGYVLVEINATFFAFTETLSEFLSKLSYAIITSTLFYLITQQIPKEKKKIKVAEVLFNTFPFIQRHFRDFEFDAFKEGAQGKTAEQYTLHCATIILNEHVREHVPGCMSWGQFLLQQLNKMVSKIDALSPVGELLDSDTFIILQDIKNTCLVIVEVLELRNRSEKENKDKLSHVSHLLFSLRSSLILLGVAANKFTARYTGHKNNSLIW